MKIEIKQNNRGYVVNYSGSVRKDGSYSYIPTEELKMIEDVAEALLDFKVRVERK